MASINYYSNLLAFAAVFLLLIQGLSCDEDDKDIADAANGENNVNGPAPDECYVKDEIVIEGTPLQVCCRRNGPLFTEATPIQVMLRGPDSTVGATSDFQTSMAAIEVGRNCTFINTTDDDIYERNEVFTVEITPNNERPDDRAVRITVILQDNEDIYVECSPTFVKSQDIFDVLSAKSECSRRSPPDACQQDSQSIDCTRWNGGLVSALLDIEEVEDFFPNVNQEITDPSTGETCRDAVKNILETAFTSESRYRQDSDMDSGECYTDCTVTLTSSSAACNLSVFILENVDIRRVGDLSPSNISMPMECGLYNITCCTDIVPPECMSDTRADQSTGGDMLAVIVGGTVGSVVGLAALIVMAVVIGVVVMVCSRRKKKTKKEMKRNASTLVQSIVYKPKRMESSGASSNSTVASGAPLVAEGGGRNVFSPGMNPNYEEVTYTESYSEWKKTFAKVTLDAKYFEYGDIIGEGEFSKVYKANYNIIANSPLPVAVKKLKTFTEQEEIDKFIAESAIMVNFDHPNILRLVGVCFNMEDNLPAIVLPYMANGDLRSFLREKKAEMITSCDDNERYPPGLSESVLLGMCMDVARGMHYLSKCKFVHRDLAARNCMVDNNMKVKVADFGLSRDIHVSDYYRLKHRQKMPVKWMAPESLFKKIYTEKTDVWSFGIVCWEIFKFGKKPYAGIDNPDLPGYISHGFRPKKPSRCPEDVFRLMQDIWLEDPEQRPNFRDICVRLAGSMKYEGDIERQLKQETASCRKEHPYQKVKIAAAQQYTKEKKTDHVYSVLEEPVYGNYSREQSVDPPPEEYEVPVLSMKDSELAPSSSPSPVHYEVPELSQDPEMDISVHYEVPDQSVLSNSPSNSNGSPTSPLHYEVAQFSASASYKSQISAPPSYAVENGSVSSVPIDYEVPQSTPERTTLPKRAKTANNKIAQRKPEAVPRRSQAHQHSTKLPRTLAIEPELPPRKSQSLARKNEINAMTSSPARTPKLEPELPSRSRSPGRHNERRKATAAVKIPRMEPDLPLRRSQSPARQNEIKKATIPVRTPPEMSRRSQSPARQNEIKKPSTPVRVPRTKHEQPPRRSQSPAMQNEIRKFSSPGTTSKTVGDNEPYDIMSFEKRPSLPNPDEDPSRYLKLNYPSVSAPNSQEDPDVPISKIGYSSLEWKDGEMVSGHSGNFNSLPSKFSLKNHVYQMLEPNGASVQL